MTNVRRDANDNAWLVFTRNTRTNWEEIKRFGRVIFAIGTNRIKHQPKLEGIEKFTGDIIHSQELKDLNKYSGKRVLVVGSGPTGADTLQFLEEIGAMKLYLSHRSEFTVVSNTRCIYPCPLRSFFVLLNFDLLKRFTYFVGTSNDSGSATRPLHYPTNDEPFQKPHQLLSAVCLCSY